MIDYNILNSNGKISQSEINEAKGTYYNGFKINKKIDVFKTNNGFHISYYNEDNILNNWIDHFFLEIIIFKWRVLEIKEYNIT